MKKLTVISLGAGVQSTTMALMALHALSVKPRHDTLPIFDVVLEADYKTLPPYMTSFFPRGANAGPGITVGARP